MASLIKKREVYYLRYRVDGVQKKKSLGRISKEDARDALAAAKIQEGRKQKGRPVTSITIDISDQSSGPKFNEFIDGYVADYGKKHPRTAFDVENRFRVGGPVREHFGDLVIANGAALADHWCAAWTEYETARVQEVAPRTVQKEFQYLRAALSRASDAYKLVRVSPLAGAKFDLDVPALEISYFSPSELEAIYDADPVNAANHRYLVNVGIRRGEAIICEKSDVGRDEMRVRPGKTQEKGVAARTVPLSEGAQEARERILFDNKGGNLFFAPVHRDTWTSRFHKARVSAGLPDGTFHWLRHTFISTLVNDVKAPLPVVKELAGHANIETTMKYVHVKDKHFHEAIGGLNALNF